MSSYKTTYHRDGTVTFWNVYTQQWQRMDARHLNALSTILFTLTPQERARIEKMAKAV